MAHAPTTPPDSVNEKLNADGLKFFLLAGGVIGLISAFITCWFFGGLRQFYLSYLMAYVFCLSFAVGGLFVVMLQHATKAGWSVVVRRVPEALAGSFPILVLLALPLVVSVFLPGRIEIAKVDTEVAGENWAAHKMFEKMPNLYPWASGPGDPYAGGHGDDDSDRHDHGDDHGSGEEVSANDFPAEYVAADAAGDHHAGDHHVAKPFTELDQVATVDAVYKHFIYDEYTEGKSAYLNGPFWTGRLLIYLGGLLVLGNWYYRTSVKQDTAKDPELSIKMRARSYPGFLLFSLLVSLAAFDLIMAVDPHWYSTIIAVYFFAGSAVAIFATMAIAYSVMLGKGLLKDAVTTEHLHDIGKFLFAFVFFWGYIAFSQYMLIWYGALAEESTWFARRGASMVSENLAITAQGTIYAAGFWTIVAAAVLVGHFIIPFAGLLSRHVKRNRVLLSFWGVWLLIFHWIDIYWLIMPEMPGGLWYKVPVVPILATVGVGGIFAFYALGNLTAHRLVPASDPRLPESLAFHNI
ncbi:MAG: hypothetical protein AAGD32_06820 [Planctomycetota bacterium]